MSNKFTAITSGESQIPVYDKEAHSALSAKVNKSDFSFNNNRLTGVSGNQLYAAESTYASTADVAWSDSNGNRIDNTYVPKSNFSFKNSTACSGISGRPLYAIESENASYAARASKADTDSNGDSITATYVPKSALDWHENEFVYLTGVSGYPISAANAEYAQEAGEAYNDTNGHAIHTTYAPNSAFSFSNNYLDTVSGKQIHANASTFASTADIAWSDSNGNRIDNTYVPRSDFSFKNSTACSAISGRRINAAESDYASYAAKASMANNDGNGDSITATYVPKSALQFHGNYLDVVSGKWIKADIAGLASTADIARSDINGNAIENTYQPKLGYSGNSDRQGIYLNSNNLYVQQYDGQNRNNVYGYVNGTTLQSHANMQERIYVGIKGQNWSSATGPSLMSLSGYISAHEGSWTGGGGGGPQTDVIWEDTTGSNVIMCNKPFSEYNKIDIYHKVPGYTASYPMNVTTVSYNNEITAATGTYMDRSFITLNNSNLFDDDNGYATCRACLSVYQYQNQPGSIDKGTTASIAFEEHGNYTPTAREPGNSVKTRIYKVVGYKD